MRISPSLVKRYRWCAKRRDLTSAGRLGLSAGLQRTSTFELTFCTFCLPGPPERANEIARMELAAGITKHKCATIAEAELLADVGAADVLLAYNLVGPNCERMARLIKAFPKCRFSVLVDHPAGAAALSQAMTRAGTKVGVLLDVDVGQHRTGIAPGG